MAGHMRKEDKTFLSKHTKNIESLVHFLNFVPDNDLDLIYKSSKIFLFPSLYEGFGLPPLEAMAAGTPVIASNSSSIPEVIGDAGILIDPNNENLWIQKISELWRNENFQKKLSLNSIERAKKFSWVQTAASTIEIYREVFNN